MGRAGTARQVYANKASAKLNGTPNSGGGVNICGRGRGGAECMVRLNGMQEDIHCNVIIQYKP